MRVIPKIVRSPKCQEQRKIYLHNCSCFHLYASHRSFDLAWQMFMMNFLLYSTVKCKIPGGFLFLMAKGVETN